MLSLLVVGKAPGVQHFSRQVDSLLSLDRFPDLTLVWIGHNNLDWVQSCNIENGQGAESVAEELVKSFSAAYRGQLKRIVAASSEALHPSAIVVFGLINFGYYFQAREAVEAQKKLHSRLYPYLERSVRLFHSLGIDYRKGTIALTEAYNLSLRNLVKEMQVHVQPDSKLLYSDALEKADIRHPDSISQSDAWHPSITGHKTLAAAAYRDIGEFVELHFRESRR